VPVNRPSVVVILAAGEGKRMRSATPKVLHSVAGRSLLGHVIEAASTLEPVHLVVVVGHGRDLVTGHVGEIAPWAITVVQEEQRGTGHAVRVALDSLASRNIDLGSGPVVVLTGDTPLLTGATLVSLMSDHASSSASATVLTARLADPTGYGRVVRDAEGAVNRIVEHKDASLNELDITEVNSGMYAFSADGLRAMLGRVTTENAQSEEYLTDVIGLLRSDHEPVAASL
jgi:bifunctional UDP-N-acetylglucosamine pyrophosphorylase/glucosamine-1-phosphate N-acetyltransferase